MHGASTSTRSNDAVDERQAPAVGDDGHDGGERTARRGSHDGAHARLVHVGRDHEAVVAHALGGRDRLAARRGRDVEHAVAGLRVERDDDRLTPLILRSDAPVAHELERAEVAGVADEQARRARASRARRRRRGP